VRETLSSFLVDLACDTRKRTAFLADPAGVLKRSSLDPAAKAALLTRSGGEIRRALGVEIGAAAVEVLKKGPAKPQPGPKPGPKPTPPKPKG